MRWIFQEMILLSLMTKRYEKVQDLVYDNHMVCKQPLRLILRNLFCTPLVFPFMFDPLS